MRRSIALLLAALLLLSAAPTEAFTYYHPGPSGQVGLAIPTLSQRFELSAEEAIVGAKAWIDDLQVTPTWSEVGLVQFRPRERLLPGEHSARLVVTVDTGVPGLVSPPLESSWRFTVANDALTALPEPGLEVQRAQSALNGLRRRLDLGPVAISAALAAAASSHGTYLLRNEGQYATNAHTELVGRPGYTGSSGIDRAGYWGYMGTTAEVIAPGGRAEEAVSSWMATLYHRIPLLHPATRQIGYGWAGEGAQGYNVLLAGMGESDPLTVPWPAPGMTGVPPEWDGRESPDPLALYGAQGSVGYPVTLIFGGQVQELRLNQATLAGPQGEVAVYRYDPGNDPHLRETVALIPRAPLEPATTYTVTMAGWIDQGAGREVYDRRWSFTTAVQGAPVPLRIERRGSEITLRGRSFAAGIKLFADGVAPVVDWRSGTELHFTLPQGSGEDGPVDLLVVNPDGQEARWRGVALGSAGGSALDRLDLEVGGAAVALGARINKIGDLFLPESALVLLGGQQTVLPGLERHDWQVAGRTGEYTRASLQASIDGIPFPLTHPPFWKDGELWLDSAFVKALTGAPLLEEALSVTMGRPAPPPAETGAFTDIAGHWAEAQVRELGRAGIVSGFPDGTFQPEASLSRAAFLKLVVQAMGLPLEPNGTGRYEGVADHWVAQGGYLGAARSAGILPDWTGPNLEPDRPITREEMAVLLVRALRLEVKAQVRATSWDGKAPWLLAERTYQDVAAWSLRGHVAVAIEEGLITGYAEAGHRYTFQATRTATRAEAAVTVARFLAAR